MPTIYEKIDKKLEKLEDNAKKKAKKELLYLNLQERFRGRSFADKIKAIITIWTA